MRYIGTTLYQPHRGRVVDVVGIEIEPGRGAVAVGYCDVPAQIGSLRGKLARVARKIARSKALRKVAKASLRVAAKAAKTGTGVAQGKAALKLAKVAIDSADRLDREARSESDEIYDEEGYDVYEDQYDDEYDDEYHVYDGGYR